MSMTDPISDMLTRIRNGLKATKETVACPTSKACSRVLDLLKNEGYIDGYSVAQKRPGISETTIRLKYFEGAPAIKMLKRVSTPGRRVYSAVADMPKVFNGLGVAVISTSKGLMTDMEARTQNVGGEVVCYVY